MVSGHVEGGIKFRVGRHPEYERNAIASPMGFLHKRNGTCIIIVITVAFMNSAELNRK